MPERGQDEGAVEEAPVPSKSARKRQMHALQALGESLLNLPDTQLERIPLDENLLRAILECRQIRSHSARKRHLQLIGKLMRNIDAEPIAQALGELHQSHNEQTEVFHQLEQLREQVLNAGLGGVELVLARWPAADRQQVRQLVLQHQREQAKNKPPAASRKLFRYLREMQELYGETG